MIDLDAIDRRHDAAVLVGRKTDTHVAGSDLDVLFACASDVPDLLRYISELEAQVLPPGGVTQTEYGFDMSSEGLTTKMHRVGSDQYAQRHSTHQRQSTVWPEGGRPNDDWSRYVTTWVKK